MNQLSYDSIAQVLATVLIAVSRQLITQPSA